MSCCGSSCQKMERPTPPHGSQSGWAKDQQCSFADLMGEVHPMGMLNDVTRSVEKYNGFVDREVKRARADKDVAKKLGAPWNEVRSAIPTSKTPTGLALPRLALPEVDEPGEIARYLFGQGLPGDFPFVNSAYREMYLEPLASSSNGNGRAKLAEEPTRLFAGLGLSEDTNARFRYLTKHQKSVRLSTAFDGPTLYGVGADAEAAFGKIGEGGVAIDTVDDMERLYAGFDLT